MRDEAITRDEGVSRHVHMSYAILSSNFAMSDMPTALEAVLLGSHCNRPIEMHRQTHSDNEGGVDCWENSRWMSHRSRVLLL